MTPGFDGGRSSSSCIGVSLIYTVYHFISFYLHKKKEKRGGAGGERVILTQHHDESYCTLQSERIELVHKERGKEKRGGGNITSDFTT